MHKRKKAVTTNVSMCEEFRKISHSSSTYLHAISEVYSCVVVSAWDFCVRVVPCLFVRQSERSVQQDVPVTVVRQTAAASASVRVSLCHDTWNNKWPQSNSCTTALPPLPPLPTAQIYLRVSTGAHVHTVNTHLLVVSLPQISLADLRDRDPVPFAFFNVKWVKS